MTPPSSRRSGHDRPAPEAGWSIGEAVAGYLSSRGIERPAGLASVARCWSEAAGPELAAHARPLRLDGSTLVVAVDHPSLVTELTFGASGLLARLAACAGEPVASEVKVTVRGTLGLE